MLRNGSGCRAPSLWIVFDRGQDQRCHRSRAVTSINNWKKIFVFFFSKKKTHVMSAQQEQEHELIQLREEKKVTLPARARDLRPHRHFSRRTPARWPSTESPLAVLPPKSLSAALASFSAALAEKQAEVDQVIALFSPGTPVCCQ